MLERLALLYGSYIIRKCRTLHHCEWCGKSIVDGELYHDGGYGKRAHVMCVKQGPSEGKDDNGKR